MMGTLITIGVILFTAGGSYALLRYKLEENTEAIKKIDTSIIGLKAYVEGQLTKVSLEINKLKELVGKHDELFKLMGFHTKEDAQKYYEDRNNGRVK